MIYSVTASNYRSFLKIAGAIGKAAKATSHRMDIPQSAFQEIVPGLFLSGADPAMKLFKLRAHRIEAIVNCTEPHEVQNVFLDRGIEYLRVPVDDEPSEPINAYFDDSYFFILHHLIEKKNVLVHCQAGISRSPTIVIYFLMRHLQWSREYALQRVREKRSCVSPNHGFWKQLDLPLLNK